MLTIEAFEAFAPPARAVGGIDDPDAVAAKPPQRRRL